MSTYSVGPMNIVVPTVGVELGPQWAIDINNAFVTVSSHNHSPGQGNQITPAGMLISQDLSFLGNNATQLNTARFNNLASLVSGGLNVGCVENYLGDLWYVNAAGVPIQITVGNAISGSPGNISGLSAPASVVYSSPTFAFRSGINIPGNIDFASAIFRNLTTGSFGLTVSVPTLSANSGLILPVANGTPSFLQIDATGTITPGAALANGITGSNISLQTIAQGNLAVRTTGSTVGAGGVAISPDAAGFITNTSLTAIGLLSVTITTTGRPVALQLISKSTPTSNSFVGIESTGGSQTQVTGYSAFFRGATQLNLQSLSIISAPSTSLTNQVPPTTFALLDMPAAGTYTYSVEAMVGGANQAMIFECALMAYEI